MTSSAQSAPLVGLPSRDVFVEAADCSNAELERRLLTLAGQIASAEAEFLIYLGAFDVARGWEGWATLPRWLSHFTAMSPVAAREHVRVARKLRELPITRQAMLEGRLSFSKVRALTRVAEPITEAELVETAQAASAAQLDRICGALVKAIGPEKAKKRRAAMSLTTAWDRDGNLVGTFCLPPEDGKALLAAIERLMPDPIADASTPAMPARPRLDDSAPNAASAEASDVGESSSDQAGDAGGDVAPDDLSDPGTAFARCKAVGLVELAKHSLATPVEDGLAATSVETVIHVDAAALDEAIVRRRLVQAGLIVAYPDHDDTHAALDAYLPPPPHPSVLAARQQDTPDQSTASDALAGFSAEVKQALERLATPGLAVGWVEDGPALALETVERLLCDTSIRTRCGHEHPDAPDPRANRLPSKAQRRRLWRRDKGCRAPGCTRTRGLHAHHVIPWWQGGTTTLDNLVLLCEAHHHLAHEGGWTLTLRDARVTLTSPDGSKTPTASPRTAGSSRTLARTRPAHIDQHTISGQQTGDPLDLGYATTVIAHNITLARRNTNE